jgi:hypothetical protein
MIVVGIDPDSDRMGVAVYVDKKLTICTTATIPELITEYFHQWLGHGDLLFSIENVLAQNFVYSRNVKATKGAQGAVSNSIGRCQQNQQELMRWLEHYNIAYIAYKPTSGNWAHNKPMFERITGWAARSNPESRSAAYFGWLASK